MEHSHEDDILPHFAQPSTSKIVEPSYLSNLPQHEMETANETGPTKNIESLFQKNLQLASALLDIRERVESMLEECRKKKDVLVEKLKDRTNKSQRKTCQFVDIGMTYFKNVGLYCAPLNDDTKMKKARGELEYMDMRQSTRWTKKDKNLLLRAIHEEIAGKLLGSEAADRLPRGKIVFSNEFKKYIGCLGSREFDWMKIVNSSSMNRHVAEECRVIWNVFLHPDIRKTQWTVKEDDDLKKISKKYKYQDWDKIAEDLDTKRSGYQCFIRFTTYWRKTEDKSSKTWTKVCIR